MARCLVFAGAVWLGGGSLSGGQARPPADGADLERWLRIMIVDHGFSDEEAAAATGLATERIAGEAERLGLRTVSAEARDGDGRLRVRPYPGGRHPRIGFLDGAVDPQRETKASVFLPWDPASYVVADVPEAIWSNLGLTYLAHTHVPTIWTERKTRLEALEWEVGEDGSLRLERSLPNGISFGTVVRPGRDSVRFDQWLRNGTDATLTDLRVQNCIMLKGAAGFAGLTNENKVFRPPFAACRSEEGGRWILTAWGGIDRCWGNADVPCLHADPRFPDCPPGKTVHLTGWVGFYQGDDLDAELARLEKAWLAEAGESETATERNP